MVVLLFKYDVVSSVLFESIAFVFELLDTGLFFKPILAVYQFSGQ